MKYIRTKDRIIDLNKTHLDGSPIYNLDTKENVIKANEAKEERDCYYIENDTIYGYWYLDGCIWDCHIIAQADTIEELCDEFVAPEYTKSVPIWIGENINGLSKKAQYEIIRDYVLENCKTFHPNTIIYGAIWTNKGLIYVAKMNDKGELELI